MILTDKAIQVYKTTSGLDYLTEQHGNSDRQNVHHMWPK